MLECLEVQPDTRGQAKEKLETSSPLRDITEYGRAVHAEMEALLAGARTARSPVGGTLYTTTFPCHNCDRHVIAAGLGRVVYIEPYPKSKAGELHGDAIHLAERAEEENPERRVRFEPFIGVGPRRYVDLFSTRFGSGEPKRRKEGPNSLAWKPSLEMQLRVPMLPTSYLDRERLAVEEIEETLASLGQPSADDEGSEGADKI